GRKASFWSERNGTRSSDKKKVRYPKSACLRPYPTRPCRGLSWEVRAVSEGRDGHDEPHERGAGTPVLGHAGCPLGTHPAALAAAAGASARLSPPARRRSSRPGCALLRAPDRLPLDW